MSYKSNRPIAAYTMAEFESLTGGTANFARGKDKKKRKSRAGLYAGLGAGALALGGAARYGGAELATRKNMDAYKKARGDSMSINRAYVADPVIRRDMGGGASGQMGRDMEVIGNKFRGVKEKVGRDLKNATTRTGYGYKFGKGSETGVKGFGKGVAGAIQGLSSTTSGKVAAGILGVGALAGGGYGIYKSMKKGKKK